MKLAMPMHGYAFRLSVAHAHYEKLATDLKKLIKYENKHRDKTTKENVDPAAVPHYDINSHRCCDEPYCPSNIHRMQQNENDVFNSLYNQPTVSFKAKTVLRESRQISVHIVRPKSKPHDHCKHTGNKVTVDNDQLQLIENVEITSDGSRLGIETESTIKSIRPCSKQTIGSLIRPGCPKALNRCDPVALYQYYQKEWKKQKFPGQENHSDLRWAVREKMLGGPRIDTVSRPSSCRRSCNSWKG
ncbi:hypothetical protein NQ318_000647 [Aromia moschata]|uniref:Centriolar and ciliogenesis-associated protein HYLS1 C-terminal domain-containing protein n=1 Tax=Aromia moschata TaxID=1265417 RepID=A0AAV8X0V4_9CUCU|nr:hypothetical protein NQ318_000647 [Aromia moschata]